MLGGELCATRSLGDAVLYLRLRDGRELVAKGVARQSVPSWEPGRPWAELVALDALSAAGAPVPNLIAADLNHGWLIQEFVPGETMTEVLRREEQDAFGALAHGLIRLEAAFEAQWDALERWAVPAHRRDRRLAELAEPLLNEGARLSWKELAALATEEEAARPGPLDVRSGNAIWAGTVTFLDMASYGYDVTEKRLVAYAQVAGSAPASLLDENSYTEYMAMRGERAAVRLAYYDLLFWAIALVRLIAALKQPESKAGRMVKKVWGEPTRLLPLYKAMWERTRVADARIDQVRQGLVSLKEAFPS